MKSRRSRREAGDLVSNLRDVKLESAPLNAHPLDPRRDETVSRIVGRRETQAATLRGKAIDAMISRIATIGYAAVARRPGFQPADVAAMVAAFEEGVAACGLARSIVRSDSPATGRAIRAAVVVSTADVADGGHARPVAIVLSAGRTRMQLTTAPALSEWRQHVVDRLHMRAEDRGDAHAVVGHALTWNQRLLETVGMAMDEGGRPSVVPVPVAGGLARGLLVPCGPCQVEAVSEIEALERGVDIGSTPRPCDPRWFDPGARASVWRGLTYSGPGDLDDRARDYAAAFKAAKATVRALEREVLDACGADRSRLRETRLAARGRARRSAATSWPRRGPAGTAASRRRACSRQRSGGGPRRRRRGRGTTSRSGTPSTRPGRRGRRAGSRWPRGRAARTRPPAGRGGRRMRRADPASRGRGRLQLACTAYTPRRE